MAVNGINMSQVGMILLSAFDQQQNRREPIYIDVIHGLVIRYIYSGVTELMIKERGPRPEV